MNFLILGVVLFMSNYSFAEWVESESTCHRAYTTEEIESLMERFPETRTEIASNLSFFQVCQHNWEWSGRTICSTDDQRLKLLFITWNYHFTDGGGASHGYQIPDNEEDPCLRQSAQKS